jgi:hypothetical protein
MMVIRFNKAHRLVLGGFLCVGILGFACLAQLTAKAHAAEATAEDGIDAEVLRISPKRTVLTVDFGDGTRVGPGGKLIVTADGVKINGTVRKVTAKGRSIIRLRSALPKSIEKGAISIKVIDPGDTSGVVEVEVNPAKSGQWFDSGFLSGYRSSGFSGLVEVGVAPLSGTSKVTGGAANEQVTFKESAMEIGFDGRARYSNGGFGGGLHFNYVSGSREATASINTISTATKDSDSIKEKTSGYQVVPNLVFSARTFGVGIGWEMRKITNERNVIIASVEGPSEPVTTSEKAARLEVYAGIGSAQLGLNALVAGTGKITEKSQKDVDRRRTGFGAKVITATGKMTHRIGFDYGTVTDKYSSSDLTTTSMGIDFQTQLRMSSISLTPRFAYEWSAVDFGPKKGRDSNLIIGSRLSFGDPYAGLELKFKNREQDAYGSAPSYKSTLYGAAMAVGMTF